MYKLDIRDTKETFRKGKFTYAPNDHQLPTNHEEITKMHRSHVTLNRSYDCCRSSVKILCCSIGGMVFTTLMIYFATVAFDDALIWVIFCVLSVIFCICYWLQMSMGENVAEAHYDHTYEKDDFLKQLPDIITDIPTIKCMLHCSHVENVKGSDEKIVTLRQSKEYNINYCKDISDSFNKLLLEKYPLVKLTVHKAFKFKDTASEIFFYHDAEQFRAKYDEDEDQRFTIKMVFDTMVGSKSSGPSKILIKNRSHVSTSIFDRKWCLLATCCLLGSCYHCYTASKCKEMEYIVYKEISLKVNEEDINK